MEEKGGEEAPSATAAAPSPSLPSPSSLASSFPLLSEMGAWRGDSRREATAWRAERRRRRRERRRRRRRREGKGEEEEGEKKKEEEEEEENDDEKLGASPSSSEAERNSSCSSSDEDDEGEEARGSGKERKEGRKKLDARTRVRAGGRFSKKDISRILRAAAACHVSIVPEVDLPGHCGAAIAA